MNRNPTNIRIRDSFYVTEIQPFLPLLVPGLGRYDVAFFLKGINKQELSERYNQELSEERAFWFWFDMSEILTFDMWKCAVWYWVFTGVLLHWACNMKTPKWPFCWSKKLFSGGPKVGHVGPKHAPGTPGIPKKVSSVWRKNWAFAGKFCVSQFHVFILRQNTCVLLIIHTRSKVRVVVSGYLCKDRTAWVQKAKRAKSS